MTTITYYSYDPQSGRWREITWHDYVFGKRGITKHPERVEGVKLMKVEAKAGTRGE